MDLITVGTRNVGGERHCGLKTNNIVNTFFPLLVAFAVLHLNEFPNLTSHVEISGN